MGLNFNPKHADTKYYHVTNLFYTCKYSYIFRMSYLSCNL